MLPIALGGDSSAPLRVLCLGAHSDDIEIGCGGTILRLLQERPCSVDWVVFSANAERQAEARASAADFLTSASAQNVRVHAFRESYFPYVAAEIKDSFEAFKRASEPDLVFSHHRHDQHQDHRLIADLTWNTFRNHLILEYEIHKYEGDLGHPNVYVPLSLTIADRKTELLLRHFPSQAGRTWFRADTFNGLMSVRGVECNEVRAEAFHARKLVL
ncbi:MAG TPA: PIG-L family deacetylase [Polyangiaceae bacterium]|jgi:LmbE family N-acetylglucosaminyl deacetylase